jgi:hypothetical protein
MDRIGSWRNKKRSLRNNKKGRLRNKKWIEEKGKSKRRWQMCMVCDYDYSESTELENLNNIKHERGTTPMKTHKGKTHRSNDVYSVTAHR